MTSDERASNKRCRFLKLLLSDIYPGSLAPDHLADLIKSGLTPETIQRQRIRSVPPWMIPKLLGFDPEEVSSALLIPFPDPRGGFMDHVRIKVFPTFTGRNGQTVKYLQPKGSGVRLYFPLLTMEEALHGDCPLWLVEGEKKSLAVSQLGIPAMGFCGIEGWHTRGSDDLISDFGHIQLKDRVVELVPDGDWRTNPNVRRGAERFAVALSVKGARPRLVMLPEEVAR